MEKQWGAMSTCVSVAESSNSILPTLCLAEAEVNLGGAAVAEIAARSQTLSCQVSV